MKGKKPCSAGQSSHGGYATRKKKTCCTGGVQRYKALHGGCASIVINVEDDVKKTKIVARGVCNITNRCNKRFTGVVQRLGRRKIGCTGGVQP